MGKTSQSKGLHGTSSEGKDVRVARCGVKCSYMSVFSQVFTSGSYMGLC